MKNHRAGGGPWVQLLGMEGFLQEGKEGGNHCWAGEKFEQNRKECGEHRLILFLNGAASSNKLKSIFLQTFPLLISTSNLTFHERETNGRLNRKSFTRKSHFCAISRICCASKCEIGSICTR
jgi:hypothetical protein